MHFSHENSIFDNYCLKSHLHLEGWTTSWHPILSVRCTCNLKFPNNCPLKDLNKLACCWNVTFSGVKHNTYLIAHINIVTAKDDMHDLGFLLCPWGEQFISLLWDGSWRGTQRQESMSYFFLHTAGSWCSCIQFQDFSHPAPAVRCVVMITNVVALAFTAWEVLNCRRVVAKF